MEEKQRNIREKNLIPFKKGKSGNPKGYPKGQRNFKTVFREALVRAGTKNAKEADEIENDLIDVAIKFAKKGNFPFYKDILDRYYGKPVEEVDVNIKGRVIILDI